MTSRLSALWRTLDRHLLRGSGRREPLPYRAWKWLWQRCSGREWESDLFDRLERTDWDLLILLDACRRDVLAEVAECAVVESARSPASATAMFLEKARERGIFEDTVYVSANPQSDDHPPATEFAHVPVYEDGWDERLSTVPPSPVYGEARAHLDGGRRVVAHTIQPHYPHVCEIGGETLPVPGGLHPRTLDGRLRDEKLQVMLASGQVDLERTRRSYRSSVAFAWAKASEFAAELAAEGYRVVVTADHGELFGEYGFVEHPVNVNVGPLVEVPWVEFAPEPVDGTGDAVTDRLAALGYAEE